MSLEHGMDLKTLSTIIGHVSAKTTLNIYTHITSEMQENAAASIDRGIAKAEITEKAETGTFNTPQKFEPQKSTSPQTRHRLRQTNQGQSVGRAILADLP